MEMTKKEEKKSDLEWLLNSLIEKGWKPRGKNYGVVDFLGTLVFVDLNDGRLERKNALDLRKLTSKESGLWQFVCENGMIEHKGLDIHSWEHTTAEHSDFWFTDGDNYEYYIIESSLKDESELEDFLLSNIVIKDE